MVASLVVRLMGSKNALVLGTTGYWLFVAANLKPSWYYHMFSCFFWPPVSIYLNLLVFNTFCLDIWLLVLGLLWYQPLYTLDLQLQ